MLDDGAFGFALQQSAFRSLCMSPLHWKLPLPLLYSGLVLTDFYLQLDSDFWFWLLKHTIKENVWNFFRDCSFAF
jgi:hypothetical protein